MFRSCSQSDAKTDSMLLAYTDIETRGMDDEINLEWPGYLVPLYPFRVLVACEFSGTVRRAFRRAGFDAWSCDLLPAEDINDGHHFKCDVSVIIHYSFISLPQVKCSDFGTMPVCAPDCPSST